MSINVSKNQHEVSGLEFQTNSLPRLDEWKNYSLSEITDPNRPISYGIVQTGPNIINGIPCLRVVDIVGGVIKTDNLIRTSASISESYRRTVLKSGDLVIPLRGKVGEIGYIDNDLAGANLTRGVALISVRPDFSSKYVKHYLSSKACADRFLASMNGSALQEITISTLRQFKVSLPSLPEQTAIANALSDVDALIQELEKLIAKKQAIKTATMQQLLTGRTRLPQFAHHPDGRKKGYKPSELGEIPEDWEVMSIGTIADVKTGPFGSALHEKDYVQSGTPIITVEHLGEMGITYQNLPLVSESDKARLRAYKLSEGDIVFSRVGSIDRNALVKGNEDGWLFSGRLLRIKLKSQKNIPSYLSFYFHTLPFKRRVVEVAVGQTMPSLNTTILKNLLVVLPELKLEQAAISEFLSHIDEEIQAIEQRLNKTRQIKQGMMQELLTGKTRLVKPAGVA
ncbi:restriction endonuclease subunit S [Vibrio cholerae]|nr:restriction endonuclease subunit S [Vibrio cholerae]EKF9849331.1 restriction endonuclease subunit S [Vibrio cholerae]EKJ1030531.1 restriction endonuclease subunit S [Vibrio cholerae]ELJ8608915.1 restriction endonuclease subunit S [Vibrio cholerae]HDI3167362.1 restriction endonuclease subunit S [Vibrio cholerae]